MGFTGCVGFSITILLDGWDRKAEPAGIQTPVEKDQGLAGRNGFSAYNSCSCFTRLRAFYLTTRLPRHALS